MRGNFEFILTYFTAVKALADHLLNRQNTQISEAINLLFDAWKVNAPVFIMGNGGSTSTATHFVADLAKTVVGPLGGRGIRAFALENLPHFSALVNDQPREDLFTAWLNTYYEPGGIGIAISVHGGSGQDQGGLWSQNLLGGMQYIKNRGGKTIGLSGFEGGPLAQLVDISIVVSVQSTPLVESFHVLIHHLIVFRLKELIEEEEKKRLASE